MTADNTVEWGEDRPTGWLDRLLGEPDEVGRRRISGPALGCAAIAVALLLAAQLTPWMVITDSTGVDSAPEGSEFYLDLISDFSLFGYYLGWLVLLALVALALVIEAPTRRLVVAAGFGWTVGLFVIVIGLTRRVLSGGSPFGATAAGTTFGPGVFFGIAAVAFAVAALALSGWQPGTGRGRRQRRESEPDIDPGPADLTVTPAQ
jgi:hypothetical protein